jgi:DNA-binding CsgD family transcriptional regulator
MTKIRKPLSLTDRYHRERAEKISSLFCDGSTLEEIAWRFNLSVSGVRQILRAVRALSFRYARARVEAYHE